MKVDFKKVSYFCVKIIFLPQTDITPNIWQGDLCDVSKCDLQCVHGGTCEWQNNYKGKYCNCPAGYDGDFCQHDTSQDVSKDFCHEEVIMLLVRKSN